MHPPDTDALRPRRRKTDHEPGDCTGGCDDLDLIDERLDRGAARMGGLETQVQEVKTDVQALKTDIAEVLDIVRLGKSFFRLVGYVGKAVRFTAPVAAALVGLYYAIKGGKL